MSNQSLVRDRNLLDNALFDKFDKSTQVDLENGIENTTCVACRDPNSEKKPKII